jgi:hypothetical protein
MTWPLGEGLARNSNPIRNYALGLSHAVTLIDTVAGQHAFVSLIFIIA